MSRKKSPSGSTSDSQSKDQPFFRPFEAIAKEALKKQKAEETSPSKPGATTPKTPVSNHGAKHSTSHHSTPSHSSKQSASHSSSASTEPEPSFADLVFGVKRLDKSGPDRTPRSPAPTTKAIAPAGPPNDSDEAVRAHLRQLVQEGKSERFEISDDGVRIEGHRLDVDKLLFRRLRRGELHIDGQCDLHKLTTSEARERLEANLKRLHDLGDNVVLVVHGKGTHSPRGESILRGEIAAWLSQGPASVYVNAFATARDEDGGEGALYVLLRRKK